MSILPISNVINVTISQTPSGIGERNVNSIALFTNDPVDSINAYEVVISPSQVAELCGTSSLTARMANAMFAQVPNIRSGNGRLVIIPMHSAVSATPAVFTTPDIAGNLANLIAVTNGQLRVTVNSINYDLSNINLSSCTTMEDVAEVLQSKISVVSVETYETSTEVGITFTDKKVGASSSVALGTTGGAGTPLNGVTYLNASGGAMTSGTNSSGETILEAIARTQGQVGYVGVLSTLSLEDAAIETASDGVQALDMLWHHATASIQDIAGVWTSVQQQTNTKTSGKVYTSGIEDAKLYNAAYVGRMHSVNTSGSMTAITANLKSLATIEPDLGISQTLYVNADKAGVDLYVSYEGVPAVYSTGGNDYFDNQYANLALKFALETAGFNYLRQTNTKVPQTESGMNGLKSAYALVMDRFVRNGYLAAGSWTSSERFGDPVIFDTNILTKGYYIYSLPIAQQSAVEREDRIAPLVQIAAKRAGAVHHSDVLVVLNA